MAEFYVNIGDGARFSKTVGEYDVYGFAGITGDLAPNHVDKAYMEKSSYGRLQAHGALMVGYMSTASSLAIANTRAGADETPVSLGYDRIRFLGPVYFGDTITVEYRITPSTPSAAAPRPASRSRTRTASWSRSAPTS
jgi:acyl dehydratase